MNSVPFLEAFRDITSKYSKIPKSRFMASGSFPIIDQGKGKIAGYFDDAASAVDRGKVVIFGDHTRAVKFAEGPFAIGADGTKVLMPMQGLFPRYAYRWLEAQELPSLGYSRHFKLLKELSVPVCNEDEQHRIANILDKTDALRAKCREAIAHLDSLGQSIFHEMFGTPHSPLDPYKPIPLSEFAKLKSGGTPARGNEKFWDGDVPWFSPKDIKRAVLVDSIEHISQAALAGTSIELFPERTVIFVVRGMILAHTFPVAITDVAGTINQDMKAIVQLPGREFAPEFLAANLIGQSQRVLENAETSAHGTKRLGPQSMRDILVINAPLHLQQEFALRVGAVERLKAKRHIQLTELDNLFLSLQDRAFKGEL